MVLIDYDEQVRQTPVGAAPPAPIATPAPVLAPSTIIELFCSWLLIGTLFTFGQAQTGRADFEVVNLVEVELRQEREAAKRELEEKRQKIIEYEATIAKLERKEKEWKAKYLELASKQLEPPSRPSEPQPMGTESSCTTPTAAIVPLPAVPAASSESLPEPQVPFNSSPTSMQSSNEPALTPLPPRSPMTPTTSFGKVAPCLGGVKGR
jgi:hypothetical protein